LRRLRCTLFPYTTRFRSRYRIPKPTLWLKFVFECACLSENSYLLFMKHKNIEKLEEKIRASQLGGGQARIDRQHEQGKLTARERDRKSTRLNSSHVKISY